MSDASGIAQLADELAAIAATVPGVAKVQARPGVRTAVRRVIAGLPGTVETATPAGPRVTLTISDDQTRVELDIVVDGGHSAPVVVRAVASNLVARFELEQVPPVSVDVRVVGVRSR